MGTKANIETIMSFIIDVSDVTKFDVHQFEEAMTTILEGAKSVHVRIEAFVVDFQYALPSPLSKEKSHMFIADLTGAPLADVSISGLSRRLGASSSSMVSTVHARVTTRVASVAQDVKMKLKNDSGVKGQIKMALQTEVKVMAESTVNEPDSDKLLAVSRAIGGIVTSDATTSNTIQKGSSLTTQVPPSDDTLSTSSMYDMRFFPVIALIAASW